MAYKITATVTSRKQKKFNHVEGFWSESQPTKAELRFLEKRMKSWLCHESGRPEDLDVWVEVEPTSERGLVPELKSCISVA